MNTTKLIIQSAVLCAAILTFTPATQAGTWAGFQRFDTANRSSITTPGTNRHGADDPANHDLNDNRRGMDDPGNHDAGDDRGMNSQLGDDRGRHRGRGRGGR